MKNANYYAVIPAPILFDKDLTPIEKVLYAHLTVGLLFMILGIYEGAKLARLFPKG